MLICGIIFINSSVHAFLDLYRDIEDLAGKDNFLAVRKFSQPPRIEDLLTIKISRQNALRGIQGSVIRSVDVPRAKCGIEAALATFKKQLECQQRTGALKQVDWAQAPRQTPDTAMLGHLRRHRLAACHGR